jgi:hypothetical protein
MYSENREFYENELSKSKKILETSQDERQIKFLNYKIRSLETRIVGLQESK